MSCDELILRGRQDEEDETEPFSAALAVLGWLSVKHTSGVSYMERLMLPYSSPGTESGNESFICSCC